MPGVGNGVGVGLGVGPGVGLRPSVGGGGGAASFVGPYDDVPSITAAYGMRRLRSAYTGSILRVRCSSDNAEQDIGYTANGDLDTAAIATFVGAGSGYVVTWYDQSGNGYNATQATAASQPLYVASGQNSKPVLRLDGTDDVLEISTIGISGSQNRAVLAAASVDAANKGPIFSINANSITTGERWTFKAEANLLRIELQGSGYTTALAASGFGLYAAILDGTTLAGHTLVANGVTAAASGTASVQTVDQLSAIGGILYDVEGTTQYLIGDVGELIVANAAWSTAQRQAAETAANDYWGVY